MQKSGRANEHIGDIGRAVGSLDMPDVIGEPRLDNFGVEADVFAQLSVVGA